MKKIIQTLILTFICIQAFPQQYGNEWVNYSQQYFRILVYQDGIYRIDSATLAIAGIDMSQLNPNRIQIFGRGQEEWIYVSAKAGMGTFKSNDYIEFYGMKNDGWYDSKLYSNPADQPNPNYSMFNDTATYFLTINPNVNPGRRMKREYNNNFSSYTPASSIFKVSRVDYTNGYYFGETHSGDITDPEYVKSEGWFLYPGFGLGGSITKSVPFANALTSGNAYIDFKLIGTSNFALFPTNHHVKISYNNTEIFNELHDGYYSKHYYDTVSTLAFGNPPPANASFKFESVNDLGSNDNPDANTIAFINIKYPHDLNLENQSSFLMYVPYISQAETYLNFSNLSVTSGDTVFFYDLTHHKRCKAEKVVNNYRVLDTNITGFAEKKCFITSEGDIHHVQNLNPVSRDPAHYAMFRDITDPSVQNANYLIISHRLLWDAAKAYSEYRANTGFDTLLVDVDELYDQFCYGIRKDPLAIKNFAHYAYDNFNSPQNLFLIGKGLRAAESDAYQCYRTNPYIYSQTLIPGFGLPPSDVLFTTFGSDFKQYIPTGRLAARNPDHVDWYLNKVMEYETAQANAQSGLVPAEWMKNVLHFGGGSDKPQQDQLEAFLNKYAAIIKGPFFGGNVKTFLKSSTDPIQQNLSDSMKTLINNGVSIMTFFGHGAGIGFDISIDYPSAYSNQGKYPFLLANSCLAGDLYNLVPSSSEEFVIIENKGTIAYLASVAKGVPENLDQYSSQMYKNIGVRNYGESLGKCIKNSVDTLQIEHPGDFFVKSACLEMTLHGDPALKVNNFAKPDYTISPTDIYFTPAIVTSQLDSFAVNFISTNIGRAIEDSFNISITREFPDHTTWDTLLTDKPATFFKDTFSINIPVDLERGLGLNTFTVTIDDPFPHIDEISEMNNSASTTLLITSDDITPIYPYKYAIVPSINVTLKASTGYPFALAKNYVFQIDTTDAFNSPALLTQTINHSGGIVTWTPVLPVTSDSIVYFWRVSLDYSYYNKWNWSESSFQYINGKHGWGQAHFFQFKNDSYRYVKYNKPARRFDFVNNLRLISAQTGYYTNNSHYNWTEEWYKLDGASMSYWLCPAPYSNAGALKIAVFDSLSCDPWQSIGNGNLYIGQYGEFHCQPYDTPNFDFYFSTDQDRDTVEYFLNSIPQNDYVLVMTHQSAHYSLWNNSLINAFQSIGSTITAANRPADNIPYIIIGKKGATPGSVPDLVFPDGDLHKLSDTIPTKWHDGDVKSVLIGPAASWDSLHWRVKSIDPYLTDSVKLKVYGVKSDLTEVLLIPNLQPVPGSMDISLSDIVDSSTYPYLRLVAIMKDDIHTTPSQMVRWQVMYKEVPETALDPSINYSFYKDTLMEGDSIRFSTAIHNISEFNMDSLLVHYWIVDANRNITPVYYHRYRPHPSGDILIDDVAFSTDSFPGLNSLWIEVNPNNDQREQYHFNNIGAVYFYVSSDKINPLLDVTFDGVHILDKDIVSAKPLIEIRLKDENKFLLMNNESDTSLFKIFIQKPDANTADRIYFKQFSTGVKIMNFYPASSANDNKCRIEYPGDFPVDGAYKLIVQAKDISNNKSGEYDYEINFEVINKSTITEVMNWPNPFSSSTRFVFTLTGAEIPTYFKIQIMTITGKVVREIGMEDLGSIHVGRNITPYAWDGKDDYGDQLANGVYLYRVITNINGKTIEKKSTDADKYFKQEFGKMFLMR